MSETLGKRIASLRKKADLTQEELAEKLDVSPQAVSKWENDMSCPDIMLLPRLAQLLGCSTDTLLSGEGDASVKYVPDEKRKDISVMFMKLVVRVDADEDEGAVNVKLNLPMELVKVALEANAVSAFIELGDKDERLKNIDMNKIAAQVISLAEKGALGKLLEVEVENEVYVDIFVE